jgi:hypothetical protein
MNSDPQKQPIAPNSSWPSRIFFVSRCLILALISTHCGQAPQPGASELATNLGGAGNARIKAMYSAYHDDRESGALKGCHGGGSTGRRIILQGFSSFDGADSNISGVVTSSMASQAFWRDTEPRAPSTSNRTIASGNSGEYGATAIQRTIRYGETTYEICFLTTTVLWDFAPAVLLYEAAKFQPDSIIMTGVGALPGTARIETAAINHATPHVGFDPNGTPYPANEIPVRDQILPNTPEVIPMTWNIPQVRQSALQGLTLFQQITGRSFQVRVISPGDRQNDYICNNISYTTLAGLQGKRLILAGGSLTLTPPPQPRTRAGFFHYPLHPPINTNSIYAWSHVFMALLRTDTL